MRELEDDGSASRPIPTDEACGTIPVDRVSGVGKEDLGPPILLDPLDIMPTPPPPVVAIASGGTDPPNGVRRST